MMLKIEVCSSSNDLHIAAENGCIPIESLVSDLSIADNWRYDYWRYENQYLTYLGLSCKIAINAFLRRYSRDEFFDSDTLRFAVTGTPDPYRSLAIYAMSMISKLSPASDNAVRLAKIVSNDIYQLVDLPSVLIWSDRQKKEEGRTQEKWIKAVELWGSIIENVSKSDILEAEASERKRIRGAQRASITIKNRMALIDSTVFGADVWYGKYPNLQGFVLLSSATHSITVSLRPGTSNEEYNLLTFSEAIGGIWNGYPELICSLKELTMTADNAASIHELLAAFQSRCPEHTLTMDPASECLHTGSPVARIRALTALP